MKTILAKITQKEKVLGYVECWIGYPRNTTFAETNEIKGDEIPEDIDTIEIFSGYKIKTKKDLAKTLETMPVGTPLKIKGIVEGMNNQQMIYCGYTFDNDIKWLKTYWFYDGTSSRNSFPERFGYFEKQMFYDGVEVTFENNEKEIVDDLRSQYGFLSAVAQSYR